MQDIRERSGPSYAADTYHCTAWEGGVLSNHFDLYKSWHARVMMLISSIKMQTAYILMPMCNAAVTIHAGCCLLQTQEVQYYPETDLRQIISRSLESSGVNPVGPSVNCSEVEVSEFQDPSWSLTATVLLLAYSDDEHFCSSYL